MDTNRPDDTQGTYARALSRILGSRRTWVSLLAILCLTVLGLVNTLDTSMAIAMVAGAVAAADGYEKKGKPNAL